MSIMSISSKVFSLVRRSKKLFFNYFSFQKSNAEIQFFAVPVFFLLRDFQFLLLLLQNSLLLSTVLIYGFILKFHYLSIVMVWLYLLYGFGHQVYTQFSIQLGNFRILSCLLKLCSCNSILLVISFRLVSSAKFTITYTDFFHALPTIIPVFRVKSFTMLMFVISSIKLPQIRNYLFHVYTLR